MAVTANQVVKRQEPGRRAIPVAASTRIYEGTMVFTNASGYADDDVASGVNVFAGIAIKDVDNSSGSNGDLTCEVWTEGSFLLVGTGFAQTSVGKAVYASDNYVIGLGNTPTVTYVGNVSKYVSSTTVYVDIAATIRDGRVRTPQSVADVHDTAPTNAQLVSAFGAAASLGRGFIGTIDDADGDTNHYIVSVSDGSFFFLKMTKAV